MFPRQYVMLLLLSGVLIERLMAQVPSTAVRPADAGFVSLFSGDSLAGWTVENGSRDKVRAAQGVLSVTEGAGWLHTEQTEFKTFVLRFDARVAAADTRAALAILGSSSKGRQIGGAHVIPLFGEFLPNIGTRRSMRTMVLRLNGAGVEGALRPAGEWQSYQVTRRETIVAASLNGALIVSEEGPAHWTAG